MDKLKEYKKEIKIALSVLIIVIIVWFTARLYYDNSWLKQDQYIQQQVIKLTNLKITNAQESAEIEAERLKLNNRIEQHNKKVMQESELWNCVDSNIEARVENKDIILCK